MDFEATCKKVMNVDPKIRFVGMINDKGRLIAGGMREDKKPLEDMRDDEMLFMELVLRTKMRREFDQQLGKVKFAMSYREKAIVMSFPLDGYVMLVSAEKGLDFVDVPFKIIKILGT